MPKRIQKIPFGIKLVCRRYKSSSSLRPENPRFASSKSAIAAHKGRIIKTKGDGMLVEFASAVDAVACAVAVQKEMAERTADVTEPPRGNRY
jgi:hypothetical protein